MVVVVGLWVGQHLASGVSAFWKPLQHFAHCLNLSCGCSGNSSNAAVAKKLLMKKNKLEEKGGSGLAGRASEP